MLSRRSGPVEPKATSTLAARLRPWAIEVIKGDLLDDGEYVARLVEIEDDSGALEVENVFWFYGEEFVPASEASPSAEPSSSPA